MLIIEQKLQERMVSFVSNSVRVLSSKDKALITDEECLMLMEAQSIVIQIESDNKE